MGLIAEAVGMSLYLIGEVDRLVQSKAWIEKADAWFTDQIDFEDLKRLFLVAFGSLMGTVALEKAATRLMNYFDIKSVYDLKGYQEAFANTNDDNAFFTAFLYDLVMHNIETFAYFGLAFALENGAYWYVNYLNSNKLIINA